MARDKAVGAVARAGCFQCSGEEGAVVENSRAVWLCPGRVVGKLALAGATIGAGGAWMAGAF